ncbi:MAG TPA: low-specificity L-threonine aldolase [Coprothermobacter proteolyticus]|nr:low-specificity L-threonine aldolase [Coprothermobacter proteolyticus]HOP45840.1 low-specificity L-threonine aldolase [Coprothermobacter proteolyticus]HPU70098.1 low-specificity L-threonine aldolase [Coprothermobacter proteolyticus]HPZ45341.1 low-specificity L-threonine aldolase [Coprothermobacter proteolyticus]HQD07844.1 low-specificity L-threonine aldolase [Coprothermobacter proteolyticus]
MSTLDFIDLRSDTVTLPTEEMRRAMAEAEVGDDVYGEDPTIQELESLAAKILGKEAALFVPSGTMGNQVSVMTHTQRGDEVIMEAESHVYYYEVGAMAVLSGVQARPVPGKRGVMDPDDVRRAIRERGNIHFPRTSLVVLENTHNRGGGKVLPLDNVKAISDIAHSNGLSVHMDGARIFNAQVASGIPASEYAKYADSVMFCLSKGLCAPVGSMVVGSKDFIDRARKNRKMLGGGMRQAGILAAAGIIALTKMVDRLQEDHDNAKLLAVKLQELGYGVNPEEVETNMVVVDVTPTGKDVHTVEKELKTRGVLANANSPKTLRLVTHYGITSDDAIKAVEVFADIIRQ